MEYSLFDRDTIIQAIREVSRQIQRSPGRLVFERLTGIRRHHWYGRYWPTWSEALQAAGLPINPRNNAIDEERLLADYLALVEALGHVPSEGEMGVEARRRPRFPASSTFRARFRSKRELLHRALAFAKRSGAATVVISQISEALESTHAAARVEARTDIRRVDAGYVYMMRFGSSYYKIGRTNKPDRRQFEIGLNLPEKVERIHAIQTDDPSGIEAYWHRRFKEKRLNGEWFRLSRDDVTDFKRRKFM